MDRRAHIHTHTQTDRQTHTDLVSDVLPAVTANGLGANGLAHGGGVHLEQPGNTILHDEALDVRIHLHQQ